MSSILEALERAEQERNARGAVSPREPLSRPKSLWRQPRVWFIGTGLLLLNLLVWWIMLYSEDTPQVAMAPQAQATPVPRPAEQLSPPPKLRESPLMTEARVPPKVSPPTPPSREQPVTQDKPVQAAPARVVASVPPLLEAVIIPSPAPVAPVPAVTDAQPIARQPAAAQPGTTVVASSEEATPVVEAPDPGASPASPSSPAVEPMPGAKAPKSSDPEQSAVPEVPTSEPVVAQTVPEVADEAVVEKVERIPEVWELPVTAQQKLKDLKITIHVYNEIPAERFVIIDMRRYREGDDLRRAGLKLESITREGVIINYGKGRVKM